MGVNNYVAFCSLDHLVFQFLNDRNIYFYFKMAVQDWEIFTTQMNAIFHCILEFTLKEGRSLPSMFNPVPYILLDPDNVSGRDQWVWPYIYLKWAWS